MHFASWRPSRGSRDDLATDIPNFARIRSKSDAHARLFCRFVSGHYVSINGIFGVGAVGFER